MPRAPTRARIILPGVCLALLPPRRATPLSSNDTWPSERARYLSGACVAPSCVSVPRAWCRLHHGGAHSPRNKLPRARGQEALHDALHDDARLRPPPARPLRARDTPPRPFKHRAARPDAISACQPPEMRNPACLPKPPRPTLGWQEQRSIPWCLAAVENGESGWNCSPAWWTHLTLCQASPASSTFVK